MSKSWKKRTQNKIRKKLKLKYVEKEMASYIELGPDAYIKKASKKTGKGNRARNPESVKLLDKNA